jgi:hypothetical protein
VLWRSYLPLALSFELMMAEAPALQAAIGRLPETEQNLAAWGLTIGLALLIESPVILLLTTTIALVKDRASFVALRKFMGMLALLCTLVTALVAFTPIYGLVTEKIMNQPPEIAALARVPLGVMLFWSAAIAWRRFFQGVLVRFEQARWMTWGTLLRLIAIVGVAGWLARSGATTGAAAAALAVMAGVLIEAVASTLFARATVKQLPPGGEPLVQRAIARFHAPLALNTLLSLLAQPLTAAALARLPNPNPNLAAWPVIFGVLLVMRGWSFAVQELTLSRLKAGDSPESLRRFALVVGIVTTLATLLLLLTPALDSYLKLLGTPARLWPLVHRGLLFSAALPLLTSLGSYVRGRRVASGDTLSILRGMAVALLVQCAVLGVAIPLQFDGMTAAALSVTASLLAELGYLLFPRPFISAP